MEKFIPYEKLSKKKKRELDTKRRVTWAIDPTVRRPANPKAYNRRAAQKWRNDDPFLCRFLFPFIDAVIDEKDLGMTG